MAYRSLLVMLDQDTECDARVQTAIRLARRLDCHLVGLAPTGLINLPSAPDATAALAEFATHASRELCDRARESADRFSNDCKLAGLKSFEAVVDEADKAVSAVHHAHCSDLTIVSQADPSTPRRRYAQEFVDRVVLASARPTLILPRLIAPDQVATNVMVAWDDSREAARALKDSLPLLRTAETVQVVCWNEGGAAYDRHLRTNLDALHNWMSWHGVFADVHVENSSKPIAQAMLARVEAQHANLVVMGAYGHSRWTEVVLGGATRGLMQMMTVPVVMSH